MVDILKKQIEMYSRKDNMRLRTAEERVSIPIYTIFFSTLESTVGQRILQMSADLIYMKEESPHLPTSITVFYKYFHVKTVTSLNRSALVVYQEPVVFLRIKKP